MRICEGYLGNTAEMCFNYSVVSGLGQDFGLFLGLSENAEETSESGQRGRTSELASSEIDDESTSIFRPFLTIGIIVEELGYYVCAPNFYELHETPMRSRRVLHMAAKLTLKYGSLQRCLLVVEWKCYSMQAGSDGSGGHLTIAFSFPQRP